MYVNIYWIRDGEQFRLPFNTINEAMEITARVLRDGGEITGIINSEDD